MTVLGVFVTLGALLHAASAEAPTAPPRNQADLELTGEVLRLPGMTPLADGDSVATGETVRLRLTLTNNGPDGTTASGADPIEVKVIVPDGFGASLVSADSGTSYNAGDEVWSITAALLGDPDRVLEVDLTAPIDTPRATTLGGFVQKDPIGMDDPLGGASFYLRINGTDPLPDMAVGSDVVLPSGYPYSMTNTTTGENFYPTDIWVAPGVSLRTRPVIGNSGNACHTAGTDMFYPADPKDLQSNFDYDEARGGLSDPDAPYNRDTGLWDVPDSFSKNWCPGTTHSENLYLIPKASAVGTVTAMEALLATDLTNDEFGHNDSRTRFVHIEDPTNIRVWIPDPDLGDGVDNGVELLASEEQVFDVNVRILESGVSVDNVLVGLHSAFSVEILEVTPPAGTFYDGGPGGTRLWVIPTLPANTTLTAQVRVKALYALNNPNGLRGIFAAMDASDDTPGNNTGRAVINIVPNFITVNQAASADPTTVASQGSSSIFVNATSGSGAPVSYAWEAACPGLPAGNFNDASANSTTWNAPVNDTADPVVCTLTANMSAEGAPDETSSVNVTVEPESIDVITFTTLAFGTPSPIPSAGTSTLFAEAEAGDMSTISYSWSASCPGGDNGSYDNADQQSPVWTAPVNDTGADIACTHTVTASATGHADAFSSDDVIVQPEGYVADLEADIMIPTGLVLQPLERDSGSITVTNNGLGRALDVVAELVAIDFSGFGAPFTYFENVVVSQGTFDPATGQWNVGDLEPDATATLTFDFFGVTTGQKDLEAFVDALGSMDPDFSNNEDIASFTVQNAPDVTVDTLDASPNPVASFGEVAVSATASTTSGDPADFLWFSECPILPGQGVFVDNTVPATTWVAPVNTLAGTQSCEIAVVASTMADGAASASLAELVDPAEAVGPGADLVVRLIGSDTSIFTGETTTVSLFLGNNGPDGETEVELDGILPLGFQLLSSTGDGSFDPTDAVWNVGDAPVGSVARRDIELRGILPVSTPLEWAVSSRAGVPGDDGRPNMDDANPGDESDSLLVTVENNPDVTINSISGSPIPVESGGIVDVVLDATTMTGTPGVEWLQVCGGGLPPGVLDDPASFMPQWTAAINNTGATQICQLIGLVTADGETAGASAALPIEVLREGVTPTGTDLAVDLTVAPNEVVVNNQTTFTLTISNNGPENDASVEVSLVHPDSLNHVSDTSGGDFAPGATSGVWTVGPLGNGEMQSIDIVMSVDAEGAQEAQASITGRSTMEFAGGDEEDAATVVGTPDVVILSGPTADPGSTLPEGTVDLSVVAEDALMRPLSYIWTVQCTDDSGEDPVALPDHGSLNDPTLQSPTWTAPQNPNATPADCVMSVSVTAMGATSTAMGSVQVGLLPDGATGADVEVQKTASLDTVPVGGAVSFTVTVRNNGPLATTGVSVSDVLPAELIYTSDDSGGDYDSTTGLWTIGSLAVGESQSLTIDTRLIAAGEVGNRAQVASSDETDPYVGNNSATDYVAGIGDNEIVLGTPEAIPNPVIGGQDSALTVTASDNLSRPLGFEWSAACPVGLGNGAFNDSTLQNPTWTSPANTTGKDEICTLIVVANADGGGSQASSVPVRVESTVGVDIALAKSVLDDTLEPGDIAEFTITATNNGPDAASVVEVFDSLPDGGFSFAGDDSGGAFDPLTGLWDVGPLANGANASLTLMATVLDSGELTNTAQLASTGAQSDRYGPNDRASVGVVSTGSETLSVDSVTANPDIVNSEGVSSLTASVTGTINSSAWQQFCTGGIGDGMFSATGPSADWTAPANPTPVSQTCFITFVASDAEGAKAAGGTTVTVRTSNLADVALIKTASDPSVEVGGFVTFVIQANNDGPEPATNLVVNDLLPFDLHYVSDDSGGAYDPDTGDWDIGTLPVGGTATLQLEVRVMADGISTNTATIAEVDQSDDDLSNNSASQNVEGLSDLDILITDITATPNPVKPLGTVAAEVTASDNLSRTLSYEWVSRCPVGFTSHGAFDDASLFDPNWVAPINEIGSDADCRLYALVSANGGGSAVMSLDETVLFLPQADLALNQVVDDETVLTGTTVTVTTTISHNGGATSGSLTVSDVLPDGLTFVSADPAGQYDQGTDTWTVGTLNDSENAVLTVMATPDTAGTYTNSASIGAPDTYDANPGDNEASVTVTAFDANTVQITSGPTAMPDILGGGEMSQMSVTAEDDLGEPLTYSWSAFCENLSGNGVFDNVQAQNPMWTAPENNTAAPEDCTITVRVTADGGLFDENSTVVTVNPAEVADLAVEKTVDFDGFVTGDQPIFTLTVTNNGTNEATNVVLNDTLPAGLSFVSATGDGSYNDATGAWTVGSLGVGANANLTLTASADQVGDFTNTVAVASLDQTDPVAGNDSASVSISVLSGNTITVLDGPTANPDSHVGQGTSSLAITAEDDLGRGVSFSWSVTCPPALGGDGMLSDANLATASWDSPLNDTAMVEVCTAEVTLSAHAATNVVESADVTILPDGSRGPDIAVTKSVDQPAILVGETATFTLTADNNGNEGATNLEIEDVLPGGLGFDGAVGDGSFAAGVWDVGSLAAGASATIEVTVSGDSAGMYTNTASLLSLDQVDLSDSNDSDSAMLDVLTENTITITVGPTAMPDTVSGGQSLVASATAEDTLGRMITYAWTAVCPGLGGNGSFADASMATTDWTSPANLTVGDEGCTLTVVATADDGSTDQASVPVTVTPDLTADLAVSKTVAPDTALVNQPMSFEITVTNNGPNDATGVEIADVLPVELQFVSATPSVGSYDHTTGVWTLGSLAAGNMASLSIDTDTVQTGDNVNTASVAALNETDGNGANDSASAAFSILAENVVEIVSGPTANPTSHVVQGLSTLTVNAQDSLDSMLEYAWTSSCTGGLGNGSFDDPSIANPSWTSPSNGTGMTETCTLSVVVTSPQGGSDSGSTDVTLMPTGTTGADIAIEKSVDQPAVLVGETAVFSVTARNDGPDAATNVTVSDLLPGALSFVGSSGPGTYNDGSGDWNVGDLAVGESAVLQIEVGAASEALDVTNTASLSSLDQTDPNGANDSASATVDFRAENTVTITAGPTAVPDSVLSEGMSALTATAEDALGRGVTYSWSSDCGGSFNDAGVQMPTFTAPVNNGPDNLTCTITLTVEDVDATSQDQGTVDIVVLPGGTTGADISVNLAADLTSVQVGTPVELGLTVRNNGPDDATGVSIDMPVPGALQIVADDGGGSFDGGTGVWTIGGLPAGDVMQLQVTVLPVAAGMPTVTASSDNGSLNETDPNPANDSDSVTIDISDPSNLSVTSVTAVPTTVMPGEVVDLSAVIDDPEGRMLTYQWYAYCPAGLGTGVFDDDTSMTPQWTAPANGTMATQGCEISLMVMGDDGAQAVGQTTVNVESVSVVSDLGITVTSNREAQLVGEDFIVTIEVTNNGPAMVGAITVDVGIPVELSLSSHDGGGDFDGATWTVGDLADQASASLMMTLTAVSETPATDVTGAIGSSTITDDPDDTNDADAVTLRIEAENVITIGGFVGFTDPLPSADTTPVGVAASDLVGNMLSYSWSSDCTTDDDFPGGQPPALTTLLPNDGSFDDDTAANPMWTAPVNATSFNHTCSIMVTVTSSDGATATASTMPMGDVRGEEILVEGQIENDGLAPVIRLSLSPAGRAYHVGAAEPVTAFGLLFNRALSSTPGHGLGCEILFPEAFTGTLRTIPYDTLAFSGIGGFTGETNAPVDIPGVNPLEVSTTGGQQVFFLALESDSAIMPTEFAVESVCQNFPDPPASISGVNTFVFSADTTAPLDILASNTIFTPAPDNAAFLRVDGLNSQGQWLVRALNLASEAGVLTANPSTIPPAGGVSALPVSVTVCRLNYLDGDGNVLPPTPGNCEMAPAATADAPMPAFQDLSDPGNRPFERFLVFVDGSGVAIPRNPEQNRLFIQYLDSGGNIRGINSVAFEVVE